MHVLCTEYLESDAYIVHYRMIPIIVKLCKYMTLQENVCRIIYRALIKSCNILTRNKRKKQIVQALEALVILISNPGFINSIHNKFCKKYIRNIIDSIGPELYFDKRIVISAAVDVTDGEECSICYDIMQQDGMSVQTNCKHCFHKKCIAKWVANHQVCPVCRNEGITLVESLCL